MPLGLAFRIALWAVVSLANVFAASPYTPAASWEVVAPDRCGWSAAKLAEAARLAEKAHYAAGIVVFDGRIVAQWGEVARPYPVRSIRKSLLNAVIGRLVAEGRLRIDQTLAELQIDDLAPGLTPTERTATVADLLRSRSGIYHPAAYEPPNSAVSKPPRGKYLPGEHFFYNNWDFNVLGTIANQAAGRSLFLEFAEHFAEPLQMQDFSTEHTEWRKEDCSLHPAYLFSMSARDLARFGLLYLREGEWRGRQLLTREWIARSLHPHTNHTIGADYGFLWWSDEPPSGSGLSQRTFSARGNGNQTIWVIPEMKTVIVLLADTRWLVLRNRFGLLPEAHEFIRVIRKVREAGPRPAAR